MVSRVLVACEFSGVVRDAFLARGHDAWSCDLLPSERPGPHLIGNAALHCRNGWDLMIAHPPCTYLANSGVRWLIVDGVMIYERACDLHRAIDFFNALASAPIERIALENPIPHKYAKQGIGQYSQIIHPWQHGHGETKSTCLWLKNLPKLVPTNIVSGRVARVHREPPSADRWKARSRTLQGIADAMADQWGSL